MYDKYFYLKTFFILFLSFFNTDVNSKFLMKDFKPISFAASTLSIKNSGGYEEGAYVEWKGPNSEKYSVFYKSDSGSYTQIDSMLIRQYSTYFRADALGLKAGSYTLKIVAENSKDEIETASLKVVSHDRSGFSWAGASTAGGKGIGAYNNDGTLKAGAKVLYVTEETKNKVTMDINGKTLTGISQITQQIKNKNKVGPVAIRIIGQVSLSGLSSNDMSSAYAIGVKEASEVTFEGVGNDATLMAGVASFRSTSIEVRNLGLMLWGGGHDGDGIALKETVGAWIHNNDFFYGDAGSAADQAKGDGSMDLKDDSQYVTVSYNHFWDSGKMSLCGMKSESGENWISYHHNWFDHSDSRHPRIRRMSVHVYNNYFDGNSKYGVGVTSGGEAFVENNFFRNCKYPMLISGQGTDAKGDGTFSGESGGVIKSYGNHIEGAKAYVKYSSSNTKEFDAYEASSREERVPDSVKAVDGGTGYSNFDTDSSLMYRYTPLDAEEVPSVVKEKAGRVMGGDFSFTFGPEDDADDKVNSKLMSQIRAYKTGVISIGSGNYKSDGGNVSQGGDNQGGEQSGEQPGHQGGDKEITGKINHNFSSNGLESEYFDIEGNLKKKDPVTINGMTFTSCLKLETITHVNFTVNQDSKLTLVTDQDTTNFKLDGEKINTDASGVTTVAIKAGQHSITKANTGSIYYISIE